MIRMRKRLACCTKERQISIDLDDQERVITFNGLESCILNNQVYDVESRTSKGDGCGTDSMDEDYSSCSSSKDVFGSFSSKWLAVRKDEQDLDQWELSDSPQQFYVKEKPTYAVQFSDVEAMKERFAKLLLGEDVTGGNKGVTTALALSNAITNLAASVFGELWKLEPLPEERKIIWRREMDWLLSPTNYMVELVPAKQSSANGVMEIMTPKPRADVHMNLPALQKLDSILTDTLDSMVNTEFWYTEVGSKSEGKNKSTRESKRWWLPSPQIPKTGLSDTERKKLVGHSKVIHQVFKAAKSINESVLADIPVPVTIKEALPKSGRANLGEELYKVLSTESSSVQDMFGLLNFKSEHSALEAVNRLEAAILAWKDRKTEHSTVKSPIRASWSFGKDSTSELDKTELLLGRAEALLKILKMRFPNLPQTFLDAKKIQYCKDVGHSILEAYSRVLGNLAFCILSRIGDILKEDAVSNPSSPAAVCIPGMDTLQISDVDAHHIRTPPSYAMNNVEGQYCDYISESTPHVDISCGEAKLNSVTSTPSRSRVWCIGKDACVTDSTPNSPCKRSVSFD